VQQLNDIENKNHDQEEELSLLLQAQKELESTGSIEQREETIAKLKRKAKNLSAALKDEDDSEERSSLNKMLETNKLQLKEAEEKLTELREVKTDFQTVYVSPICLSLAPPGVCVSVWLCHALLPF